MKAGHKTATAILFVVSVTVAIVAAWTIGVMPAGAQTHAGAAAAGTDPEPLRRAFIPAALRADSPALPANQHAADDTAPPPDLDSTESIQLQPLEK